MADEIIRAGMPQPWRGCEVAQPGTMMTEIGAAAVTADSMPRLASVGFS
jgi:hypothetical protein